jgi:lauroyl/myristoyl acyltransferase
MRSSLSELDGHVEAGIAEAEAATAHLLEVRGASLISRLRGRGVQRAVPAPVGVAAAAAYACGAWLAHGSARSRALAWAETMLGPGAGATEVERLARRHLIEWSVSSELGWRPWLARRMKVDGMEHLEEALCAGRGAIVGMPHFGPQLLLIHALCARAIKPYLVSGGERTGVVHGDIGAWREFSRRHREAAGCRTVWLGDAFPVARALLERGEVLVVAWDVRGRHGVDLLDRPAWMRGGAAQLAAVTGAALLPGLVWREGTRPRARIGAPLEPRDDPDALLNGLAADLSAELRPRMPQAHPLLANVFDPLALTHPG